jgi:hypothetical protein
VEVDPRALVADTVMPNFHLSTKDAQALAMLMLSWKKAPFDAAFLPGVPEPIPRRRPRSRPRRT